jgi:hypothetical protein
MYDIFRDLLVFGEDIGEVKTANMYSDNFCSVEGEDKEGNQFALTFAIKQEPVCENITKRRMKND